MKLTPLSLSILTTTLISGVAIALAWTGPTGSPFNNNTAAPINAGGVDQTKSGGFGSNGFVSGGGLKVGLNTMLGSISATPRSVLEVNGNIGTTAAYDAGYNWANINAHTYSAISSIYSYGYICTGNASGNCTSTGGVVLGPANTSANVNISNTTNSFFNVGNFGIGTNNPLAKLHIGGSNNEIRVDYDGTNNYYGSLRWAGLQLGNNGENRIVAGRTAAGGNLSFYVNNTNDAASYSVTPNGTLALKILANGNTGIGTTTPSQALSVNGTIYSSSGGFRFPDGSTQTTSAVSQWTTAGTHIYNANTGNVGIGTGASPVTKLDVNGGINIVNNNNLTWGGAYGAGTPTIAGALNTGLYFYPTGSTSGSTGILTATGLGLGIAPTARLQVSGDTILAGTAGTSYFSSGAANYIRGNTYFNGTLIDEDNGAYYLNPSNTSIFNAGTFNQLSWGEAGTRTETRNDAGTLGGQSGFYQTSAPANYYAGASSWQHLIEARHTNTGNNYALQIAGSFFDQDLYFRKTANSGTTGWSKVIAANSAGNVGIGMSPITKLHVAGTLAATDWIGAGCESNCEVSGGYALMYANGNIVNTGTIGSTGAITSGGVIRSTSGGFQFPDNTIQTTAAPGAPYRIWQNWSAPVYGVGIGSDNAGGWSRRYGFTNSTGSTLLGGFGGYGGAEALSYLWIGTDYNNASIQVTPSNKQTLISTAAGDTHFGYVGGTSNYLRGTVTYFNGTLSDENNGGYYINPDGVSVYNDLRSNILYDQQNTGYYVDPNSSSNLNNVTVQGNTTYGTVRSGDIGVYDPTNTQAVWTMGGSYTLPAGGASTNYGNFYGLGFSYEPNYGAAGNNPQSKAGLSHQLLVMHAGTTRTAIGNGIWSNGIIHSASGGFRFPDGTTQTTAATAGFADAVRTGVAGDWNIASNSVNASYSTAAFEIRESNFAGAGTGAASEAPRIGFHWSGRVASQIGMDSAGVIRTYNNPGTGYEAFAAAAITANGALTSTGTITGAQVSTNAGSHLSYSGTTNYLRGNTYANGVYYDENNAAYYVDPASTSIYNDLRSNILYDNNNTGYYVDSDNTSRMNTVQANRYISPYSGTDSGLTGARHYEWGYQEGGAWSGTYPDLILAYHTGVKMGANPGYGGVRFYADHPSINSTEIFSVGNTDGNVRVANSIYATAFIYNSDRTLKQDIVPLDKSLDKVRALQGYTFTWIKDGRADVGVIAQEVENIYPELVHTDVTTGLKSVEYGNLVAPLIEAVKELANAFDALATRVFNTESRQTELEKQNEIQAQQIAELQRQINLLQAK